MKPRHTVCGIKSWTEFQTGVGGQGLNVEVQIFEWITFNPSSLKTKKNNWIERTCLGYKTQKGRVTLQAPTRFWGTFGGLWGLGGVRRVQF